MPSLFDTIPYEDTTKVSPAIVSKSLFDEIPFDAEPAKPKSLFDEIPFDLSQEPSVATATRKTEPIPVNRTPIVSLSGRQVKEPTINSLSELNQKIHPKVSESMKQYAGEMKAGYARGAPEVVSKTPVEGSFTNQAKAVIENLGKGAVGLVAALPQMASMLVNGTGDEKMKMAEELIAFSPVAAFHLLNAAKLIPAPMATALYDMTTDKTLADRGLTPQQRYDRMVGESQKYVHENPLETLAGVIGGKATISKAITPYAKAPMAMPEVATGEIKAQPPPVETPKPEMVTEPHTKPVVEPQPTTESLSQRVEADAIKNGLHPKTLEYLNQAMANEDIVGQTEALQRVLRPDNKLSRSVFTARTGVKLPRTRVGTNAAIGEWQVATNPTIQARVRAEIAKTYPDKLAGFNERYPESKSTAPEEGADWVRRGDKLHKTEAGATAHMKAASAKYPDMEFKVVPEGEGFVLQQKAKGGIVNLHAGVDPFEILGIDKEDVPILARNLGGDVTRKQSAVVRSVTSIEGRIKSPLGKQGIDTYRKAFREEGPLVGGFDEPLRGTFYKLSKAESEALGEAQIKGEVPTNPKLKAAYDEQNAANQAIATKIQEVDPNFKPRSDFGMTWRLKPEIAKILKSDIESILREARSGLKPGANLSDKALAGLIDERIGRIQGNLSAEMKKMIAHTKRFEKRVGKLIIQIAESVDGDNVYHAPGTFTLSRTSIPLEFFDRNAIRVQQQYNIDAARHISLLDQWGPLEDGRLKGFDDYIAKLQETSPYEAEQMRMAMKIHTGEINVDPNFKINQKTIRATLGTIRGMTYGMRMGIKSTLQQGTQPFISYVQEAGVSRTAKGVAKYTAGDPATVADVLGCGVIEESPTASIGAEARGGTWAERAANKKLAIQGFSGANRILQVHAAASYREAILAWYEAANGRGLSAKMPGYAKFAQRKLEQGGIDYAQPLTQKSLREGMFEFTQNSQQQRNIIKDPVWMNTPMGKNAAVLQRFAWRQAKYIKDTVAKELGHGNPAPLLRLMAGGLIAGESYIYITKKIESFLSGHPKERGDLPWKDILRDKNVVAAVIRALNDYAAVGSLGFVTNLAKPTSIEPVEMSKSVLEGLGRLLAPAPLDLAKDIGTNVQQGLVTAAKVIAGKKTPGEAFSEKAPQVMWLFGSEAGNLGERFKTEDQRKESYSKQMANLKKLGFTDEAQKRIAANLQEFKGEQQADLALAEYDRTYTDARQLAADGKYDAAYKMVAKFFERFPEFSNLPSSANKRMKLTGKVIREFLESKEKREKDIPDKTKQRLMLQYQP